MISLIAGLSGFLTSFVPEILKIFRERQDNKQELAILQLQAQIAKDTANQKLEAIKTNADIQETTIIHQNQTTNIKIVEAIAALVRPTIALSYLALYAFLKVIILYFLYKNGFNIDLAQGLWNSEDQATYSAVIGYYFGNRSIQKYRNIK